MVVRERKKKLHLRYKDGLAEGLLVRWSKAGRKIEEARYRKGKRFGLHRAWDENRDLWKETRMKDVVPHVLNNYDETPPTEEQLRQTEAEVEQLKKTSWGKNLETTGRDIMYE